MTGSNSALWRPILINKLALENHLKYDQLGMQTKGNNCYSIYNNQPPFCYEIHRGYKRTLEAGFVFNKNTLYLKNINTIVLS